MGSLYFFIEVIQNLIKTKEKEAKEKDVKQNVEPEINEISNLFKIVDLLENSYSEAFYKFYGNDYCNIYFKNQYVAELHISTIIQRYFQKNENENIGIEVEINGKKYKNLEDI